MEEENDEIKINKACQSLPESNVQKKFILKKKVNSTLLN